MCLRTALRQSPFILQQKSLVLSGSLMECVDEYGRIAWSNPYKMLYICLREFYRSDISKSTINGSILGSFKR